jgi:L-iditol 2-dehydrogenase
MVLPAAGSKYGQIGGLAAHALAQGRLGEVPAAMRAAVYLGNQKVSVESIPTPEIGEGEVLIQVESCGICHTDLKKIEYDLLAPPRVFGHETAGVIAAVGAGVTEYAPGDRVVVFHHIPCMNCFYCRHKLYAQCPVYKRVGVTAGFEPAGGGFAQYVRAMDWIVRRGIEKIPEGVAFERASFVEPVNTCVKGFAMLGAGHGDVVVVLGQGPIGLIFTMLARRAGATVLATDAMAHRRGMAEKFGALAAYDPRDARFRAHVRDLTEGRGADFAIVAASARGIVEQAVGGTRPGAKILLFAQTSHQERIEVSGADVCVGERALLGSYSASVDLQKESADLVFSGALPVEDLISDIVALDEIGDGIELALHPLERSLKIMVQPQRWQD